MSDDRRVDQAPQKSTYEAPTLQDRPMKRRISAIIAADIVGYSKLVAEDEEETIRRLVVWRTAFGETTTRYGGLVVNAVGDAILAEFPSAVDAVRCAMDIHESIRNRNLAYPPSRHMTFRMGITVGDVVDREGQLFGDSVNVAARLEGLASPGGICVSRTVYEQAANKLSVKFEDIGRQQVKNMPEPIQVYRVALNGGDTAAAEKTSGKNGSVARRRWLALAAAVVVVTGAAAWQVYRSWQAPTVAGAPPQSGRPAASLATPETVRRFDEAKVRALAATQGIPLPRALQVMAPAPSVPADIAAYLGAWGGERRWSRLGRQAILIVESVDKDGAAIGFYAHGIPANPNATNRQGRFVTFVGSITEKGLQFEWAASKFIFKLMPDGSLWGKREPADDQGQFDLTITLSRIE